jgi:hypothetical protein
MAQCIPYNVPTGVRIGHGWGAWAWADECVPQGEEAGKPHCSREPSPCVPSSKEPPTMLNAARSYAQKRASELSVSNWVLRSTKVGVVLQQVSSKIFPRFIDQTNPHNTCYHAVLAAQWFKRAGSAAGNSPARHTIAAIPLQKSWSKMTPIRRYTTQVCGCTVFTIFFFFRTFLPFVF